MSKNLSISEHTPTIAISDNRGLGIRALAYNRTDANPVADELISRNRYNAVGQLIASRDARLEIDNFHYDYNLAGAALRTEGVDNGTRLQLTDIEGRPRVSLDAKGTRSWVTYEPQLGRPLEHQQQAEGGQKTITDRFFYAENTEQHKAANLNGQCIRYYDTAGLQQVISLSITGVPLQQQRQLLTDTLGPVDWFAEEQSWQSRLDDKPFITRCSTDALGQPLTQTDAKNHTQHMAYNRAGQLSGSWLTLHGGIEQVIVKSLTYSAAGQKLWEESGNGVVTEYRYEAETQRLIGIKTTRPALKDRPTLLQDLRYDYDPVGNILAIHNDAEATRFYRNQKIVPETTYRYDALYQLIEATGRESDKNSAQSANLPDLISLTDGNQYVNYTRRYTYDRAGNLLKIQHTGASQYSTHITVSHTSNHGIQQQDGLTAADIRSQFDASGNQQQLQPGQPLQWDARNQLQQVTTVKRSANSSANNDRESYLYGSDGMRVVKHSIQHTGSTVQTAKVTYLPGLELRTQHNNNKLTEDFQVITVGAAGRAQVRVLLWQKGQPDGIDNGQLRYSFDNQIGSSLLELDNNGDIISQEEYYPFGGTAVFASRNTIEAKYKTVRYSGKERDATGLYYYGLRYYMPWLGRWLSSDPAGTIDGLNLYRMVRNNPVSFLDVNGLSGEKPIPKTIRHVWLGNDINALEKHKKNILRTKEINPTYEIEINILVKVKDEKFSEFTNSLTQAGIKIKDIEQSSWFSKFKKTKRYTHFNLAMTGERSNFASASDILRKPLMFEKGGIYTDVDDVYEKPLPETITLLSNQISTTKGVVFSRWGGMKGVHISAFATHKKNPLLEKIMSDSYKEYENNKSTLYQKNPTTDNPDDNFHLNSSTSGSFHFSKFVMDQSNEFKQAYSLFESNPEHSLVKKHMVFSKILRQVTTSGAGHMDAVQTENLVNALAKRTGRLII
ncbi:RHS repeat-associated core domain-containing protein [Yersinia sp. LJYL362]|uniref:RHS repeat-associated core domain-containing protein n=1 Tax=Yersinia sp. LJYL362 TaxID=3402108 RepID=UPI003AB83CFB